MYVSKINDYSEQREEIKAFIEQYSFGLLVAVNADGMPHATHLPLELEITEGGEWRLSGHVARANEAWKIWEQNPKAIAIFSGAHAFVSSSWYEKNNVSTWNYLAVHLSGEVRIVQDETQKMESLRRLTNRYESGMKTPRSFESLGMDYIRREMRGIVVIEMAIQKIDFAKKLSQNRNSTDFQNIIHELSTSTDINSQKVAEEMRKIGKNN